MPLVRAEVRNEYAFGAPELYREADKEDPKEILEGVAVCGLVGVLRQLGDLAEFAAEVFHGLQEDVSVTFSRSHKLMTRVQRIEAALSPLEKAVLAQRSHLHFAYTAGSNWHTRIRCGQNHFVCSEVPCFIMDSYEDSRDPPRLHMLDRFDPGGPGSCLKRYSDPTFFRRTSEASGVTVKTSKDKKNRKKKRRSWPKNGEVSRGASFSHHNERMQFTGLNVDGHNSPTQTTFTDDATTLRSDWGEQSNVDLRNASSYIEGDFRPSYSTQPEEQESRVSISSPMKRNDNDFLDFDFLEAKADAYDDNLVKQSIEEAGCSSSSVTYDDKTEILEPAEQDHDHDAMSREDNHDIDLLSQRVDRENKVNNATSSNTADNMDIQSCNRAEPKQESGDIALEGVESETDDFVDALNNIDSESETDVEFTRKQEVENSCKIEHKVADERQRELAIHNSAECQPSNSESDTFSNNFPVHGSYEHHNPISVATTSPSATYSSSSKTAAQNELNEVCQVDEVLPSAQGAEESSDGAQSFNTRENEITHGDTNVESVSCSVPFNYKVDNSRMQAVDGTRSSADSPKPGPETAAVAPCTIWTNGGLLGLQPSKPPDWNKLNSLPEVHLPEKDEIISSSCKDLSPSDKLAGKPCQTENSKTIEEDPEESGTTFRKPCWKISPADLDVKLGRFGDSLYSNNASSHGAGITTTGTVLVNTEIQAARKQEENYRSSSRMFELGNRLLTTGSNKKLMPDGDQNSRLGSYQNGNACEQKIRSNVAYGRNKDISGFDSLILSPSSSPPLQHMKILLQPIDGFETSKLKLKLKFCDGSTINESKDIFPSFQLVPEVSVTRHNVGSDSDDDTFYRSSPSLSDDCHSHHSESNSEQWESGESPRTKDHDLYDTLQRLSLTESVSTVPDNGSSMHEDMNRNCGLQFPFVENSIQNSQSCRSFDLQSLDTLNQSFREELRTETNSKNLPEPLTARSPSPPPLPPVEWRGMKPLQDAAEHKCSAKPEGFINTFDVKHSESTISQQPKPAPLNNDRIFEATKVQKGKILSSQKSNGHKEATRSENMEEKDDFLHQIRTKSFNLRPIATGKTTMQSGGSGNFQVTAILEKANAIRQAVASDDGEDDSNWSDT